MAFQKYQQKYYLVREANTYSVTTFMAHRDAEPQPRLTLEPQLGAKSPVQDCTFVLDSSTINAEPQFSGDIFLVGVRVVLRATGRRAKVRMDFLWVAQSPPPIIVRWLYVLQLPREGQTRKKNDSGWIVRMNLLDGSPNLGHPICHVSAQTFPQPRAFFPACSFQWARTFFQVMRTWSCDAPSSCSTTALHRLCPALHL